MGTADLERRTITALVYGVVVLAALFAPWPTFAVLVAILAVLGYLELRALFRYRSYQPWLVGVVFVVLFILAHLYGAGSPSELMVWTLLVTAAFGVVAIAVFVEQAMRGRPLPAVLGAVLTLGGALYLGYFFGFLIELWRADDAATRGWLGSLPVWLILALVPTWAADVAAYLVGARIGRRRIAPRISPGKTWEGTLAGFAAAAIVALLIATSAGIKTGPTLLLAVLVGPVGFASDLLESAIKRAAGAKDSGTLLPGHGGVLDRIDSLIFVAPAVAFVLWLARGAYT
ncbi:MAG TPA: phosphatidate cytidylyltransferase [Candidatus Limnocylindria bacterium]|jgi:phosphatidate cytidylyltransferase|nr:phosphatidate cytidylyltransferase [Candidatus Limnocylindria bacterium]